MMALATPARQVSAAERVANGGMSRTAIENAKKRRSVSIFLLQQRCEMERSGQYTKRQRHAVCFLPRQLHFLCAIRSLLMVAFPSTVERVPLNTSAEDNERIWQQTEMNVALYTRLGDEAINRRLQELEQEWDIERMLEANAASVSLIGLALGATVDRRLFILPALVAGFLLQHAVQGWCPPIALLRRLGFRTATEIDEERYALKALRGDFRKLNGDADGPKGARQAITAVRR